MEKFLIFDNFLKSLYVMSKLHELYTMNCKEPNKVWLDAKHFIH